MKEFLPKLGPAERVATYSLVGGIPHYLCALSTASSLEEVIEELIASPTAMLLDEKDLILREEFRDPPHTYAAILSAIARGYGTPAKIVQVTGIDASHTHKYLAVLNTKEKKAVVAEVEWSAGTSGHADRLAKEAMRKAIALLPKGYEVVASYAALREVSGEVGDLVITPETLESG